MAIGSGLSAQLGLAPETVYGTFVAPTSWTRVRKADLKKVKNTAQTESITAGSLVASSLGRVTTTRAGEGSVEVDITTKKMGLLLQGLMGTSVTPTLLTGSAYSQTHTLADSAGKSLSIQLGIPEVGGTVRAYSYSGCKVTSASFEIEPGAIATATFDFDAQDVSEVPTLGVAAYSTTQRPFSGVLAAIKVGTYGAEASVTGVRKVSVKIDRKSDTERFYLGGAGLKSEPIANEPVAITGTISADYIDKTVFADKFAADTGFSLVVEIVGSLITGAHYDTFRITLPGCYLDGDSPTIDGAAIISGDFPFTYLYDGTNLPKIEVISAETTLV
jgi:hypothetical protein